MLRNISSTIKSQTDDRRRRQKRRMEQELPDLDQAIRRAHESVGLLSAKTTTTTSVAPRRPCICKCPHLKEFLPHELSLELAQTATTGAWTVKDPVHALHLASQMDIDPTTGRGLVFRGGNVNTASSGPTMILYGDEQERLLAFATRGFTEQWHPFSFNWETLHRKEQLQEEARQRRLAAEKVAAAAMAATTAATRSAKTNAAAVAAAAASVATATTSSAVEVPTTVAATATAAAEKDKPHPAPSASLEDAKIKTEGVQDASTATVAVAKSSEAVMQQAITETTTQVSDAAMQVESTNDEPSSPSKAATAAAAAAVHPETTTDSGKAVDAVQQSTKDSITAATKQEITVTTTTTEPMQVDPSPIKQGNPDVVIESVMGTSAAAAAAAPIEIKNEEETSKPITEMTVGSSEKPQAAGDKQVVGDIVSKGMSKDTTAKDVKENDGEKTEQAEPAKTKETVETSIKEADLKSGNEQPGEDIPKEMPSAEQASPTVKSSDVKPAEQKVEGIMAIPKMEDGIKSSTEATLVDAAKPSDASTSPAPEAQQVTANAPDTKPVVAAKPASTAERKTPIPKEEYLLDEARFWSFQAQEAHISQLRKAFFTKRSTVKKKSAPSTSAKRRKSDSKAVSLTQLPAWREHSIPPYKMDWVEEQEWHRKFRQAETKIEQWLHYFRHSREMFWQEKLQGKTKKDPSTYVFGALDDPQQEKTRCCRLCDDESNHQVWFVSNEGNVECSGDSLMQCLECPFVGCAPSSVSLQQTNDHMMQHYLTSNHTFAVTCGPQANVFCFKCMDFVYHEIFDMEKERIDLNHRIPRMGWKHRPVQRSFDAFQFVRVPNHGIVWKGMHAAYLTSAPAEHVRAARAARWRQIVFNGEVDELPLSVQKSVIDFCASQSRLAPRERSRIPAPVGMYNLGNTCFQSAVLQCLIACVPIQKYFLHDMMHHHASCAEFRRMVDRPAVPRKSQSSDSNSQMRPCLACELDKLILRYFGSVHGVDVFSAVTGTALNMEEKPIRKGEPLVTSEMLTSAWNCGGMNHLAGYDQRDAHEFLHGFLDNMSKHDQEFHHRIAFAVERADSKTNKSSYRDIAKTLFEGTFRSVLVCQQCGNKRAQSESFMSISLDLSKEVHRATAEMARSPSHAKKLSVERCLNHFTMPETLADPVDCPSCKTKTLTKKQHVVSKLPRVLCLHLKRFDAAHNAKVEDFVSFPEKDLNMGQYLPHWCEVPRVPSNPNDAAEDDPAATAVGYVPDLSYNLFATVNHFGNMQSGHYTANVLVDGMWYHCNDANVSYAGNKGNGASQVLASDGAYLLFYIRK